ncbi:tRNA lysidine(34) synthetase TilS [Loktanella sp. M215]|uniref:tRNA lysidine(34) synthetase TilS n=1 Tax=Loktanella sp. M215 TaxID=2675431 RepID=UPI001F00F926|nr:tRNA lysidine(34) synthetase TilS [Loktanella sp. M215]
MLGPDFPRDIAVAVSGGGDSMAMLHLAAAWARVYGVRLWVVTVDHGLRTESAAEATMVADACAALGLPHSTLRWTGWDGQGNLQDTARRARRDLIGGWRGVCGHVLMAHTRDDQAETLLMRLARGSGVDGLAAMAVRTTVRAAAAPVTCPDGPPSPATPSAAFEILRPLLDTDRAALRHYLKTLHIPYVDDPSNDDDAYARVRMRRLIGAEGLDVATLADTARQMGRAQVALDRRAHDVAVQVMRDDATAPGAVVLDRDGFAWVEAETQLRILAAALQMVATATYRPRLDALEDALARLIGGGTTTLHGGIVVPRGDRVWIAREPARVAGRIAVGESQPLWDGRWRVFGPNIKGLSVGALGEAGLAQIAAKPAPRAPRLVLAGLPGVWDGDRLVACQPLRFGPRYVLEHHPPGGELPNRLLAH